MIQLAIAGATGRMGRGLMEAAARDDRFDVAAGLTFVGDGATGTTLRVEDLEVTVADRLGVPCDVLIDFSTASGTIEWLEVCERLEIPMVTGVTGHTDEHLQRLRDGARIIPIVLAPNFSVGMRAMLDVVGRIAERLGVEYDVEVVEAHHRHKADAPSGTALSLVRRIREARGRRGDPDVIHGRHGDSGERPRGQIGVHAIRMGELVGQHEVHFSAAGETLTVRHAVQSRNPFISGALRAAEWVLGQPPGLYSIDNVLAGSADAK